MKNFYFAKKTTTFLWLLVLLCASSYSQTVSQVGTENLVPTGTIYAPIWRLSASTTNDCSRANMLYTVTELAGAGITPGAVITKLAFNKIGAGATVGGGQFAILMDNSNAAPPLSVATTWAAILASHTPVYSSTNQAIPANTGWIEFTLTTPFTYTGGSLEIAFDWNINGVAGNPTTDKFDWQYSSGTSDYIIGQVATTTPPTVLSSPGTIYKHRPNIQFTYTPGPACTTPPTPGIVLASPATTVCQLTPVTLSVDGNSTGFGQTYRWQTAAAVGGPYTDITAEVASPSTIITPSVSGFYRAVVTCSGQSANTTPVEVVVNPGLPAGTYTINSAVATGGTNYQTFAAAIAAMNCGIQGPVVFNVNATSGPYNEQVVIPQIINSSAVNTITFNGNGRTIQAVPVTGARHIVKFDGADYVTFNNFNIVSQDATYGWGVHFINAANNNILTNCTIDISAVTSATQANSAGIVASNSSSGVATTGNNANFNTISNNTIIGAYQSIIMHGIAATRATNNIITGNTLRDFYATGIELTYHTGANVNANDIHRANRTAVTTFTGIEIGSNCNSVVVNANRIHDTHNAGASQAGTAQGIYFNSCDADDGTENIVSNNLLYNFNSGSGTQYGLYNSSSNNVWYYHNTVVLDNASSTGGVARGFYQTTMASGIELKNNLFTVTRAGTGVKHDLYFNTNTTTFVSNNNLLHKAGAAGNVYTSYISPTQYASFLDWQAAGPYDQASDSIAPVFASPATGNYQPVNNALNNRGVNVSITTDILNLPRSNSTPDIGAYEFDVSGCVAPPTAGTAAVSPNGVLCAGTAVEFTVTGNSIGTGQTYQWQSSATSGSGFTNISPVLNNPAFNFNIVSTQYYRLAVTCSGNTQYSNELLITVPALFPAGTYTINSAVATGGSNFQTLAAAVSAIQCGVTGAVTFNVDAASGPYNEQITIPQITGANAANRIVFNGNGRTLSFLSTNPNERAGIKLNGADFVTINNFVITGTGTSTTEYGFGIQVLGDADNNIITNNVVNINKTSSSANYSGIAIGGTAVSAVAAGSNTDNTIVSGNTVSGGNYGISVYGTSGNLVLNNQVTGNTITDQDEEGIYIAYTNGALVENNDISRPTRATPDAFTGVYFVNQSLNGRVSKNKIHDPFGGDLTDASTAQGIYFTSCDATAGNENIVSNNIIYNFKGGAIQYGIYNNGSDSVRFYHNSISLDDAAYTGTSVTRGFYQLTTARGIEFKNNIVQVSRGGAGIKHLLYFGATTTASTILSENNDLYKASAAGSNYTGYLALPTPATNITSLVEWRTASGQDLASDSLNPFFTDAAAGNLAPREILLDNKGVNVGISTDIVNATRSASTPDVGAYEFIGSITLPVKLTGIFASRIKTDIIVNWKTATEINSAYFEIERSTDGISFTYAGTTPAKNIANGAAYNFKDAGAVNYANGPVMYYRLKMVDTDGSYEYSKVAIVKLDKELITAAEAYPNPFTSLATLRITVPATQAAVIKITAINGSVIHTEKRMLQPGVNLVSLDKSRIWLPGTYIATIEIDQKQYNLGLIKQ